MQLKLLKWSNLRSWGHSRLLRTSYLWIVAVPLSAKALAPIAGNHAFTVLGSRVTVHFGLPFSWQVFYFMAIAFSIGQALYTIRCPEILRDYRTFTEFRNAHQGIGPILRWLRWTVTRAGGKDLNLFHGRVCGALRLLPSTSDFENVNDVYLKVCRGEAPRTSLFRTYEELLVRYSYKDPTFSDVFDAIGRTQERFRERSLLCSATFFLIGFVLFLAVMVQNLIYVVQFMRA